MPEGYLREIAPLTPTRIDSDTDINRWKSREQRTAAGLPLLAVLAPRRNDAAGAPMLSCQDGGDTEDDGTPRQAARPSSGALRALRLDARITTR